MGKLDTTLFIKIKEKDMLLVQIYVDDIIFGSTNPYLCEEFSKCMHNEFEMSMMGEPTFFLGLKIKPLKDDIFLNQEKYTEDLLKRFKFNEGKIAKTPMRTSTKLDKDKKGRCVDIKSYRGMIGSLLYLTASNLILCLVYVFVLGFNLVLRNLIYMPLKEYLNICFGLLI